LGYKTAGYYSKDIDSRAFDERRGNIVLLRCVVVICLSATIAYGQVEINDRDGLVNALFGVCRGDLSCSSKLLETNKALVTTELWRQSIDLADSPLASSLSSYQIALQIATRLGNKHLQATTYYKTGRWYFGQGKIDLAIEHFTQSKALFGEAGLQRDLIYVLADLGLMSIYKGDYIEASRYSEESLTVAQRVKSTSTDAGDLPDEYGIGTALSNLGYISRRNGDYDQALDYFQHSLTAYQAINNTGEHTVDLLDDLAEIGRTYSARGDYLRALNFLSQAMNLATGYPDRMASVCNSLGIVYTNQRDYEKAIDYFQRGFTTIADRDDEFSRAELLLNLGVAHQFQQNYEAALTSFQKAADVAGRIKYSELLVPIYEGKGAVLKAQGKYAAAADVLTEAFQLAKTSGDKTRIAELLWRQSEVNLLRGDAAKSIVSGVQAIQMAEQLSLRNVRYLALTTLGKAYRARGENDLAMQTFKKAIAQIEEMRNQVAGLENERQLFFEDKVAPYHEIVDILLATNNPDAKTQALLTAESAKARVLLDVLSTGRVDLSKAMSLAEKDEQAKLNKQIVDLNVAIAAENTKHESDLRLLKDLNEQLRAARIRYETFQNSICAAHSELGDSRSQVTPITTDNLSSLLNPSEALLEYVVTETKTYLFVLTKDQVSRSTQVQAYQIQLGSHDVAKETRQFRDLITTQGAFTESAQRLYDLLLRPAEQQLKGRTSVCIIPDGALWDLPFQALQPRDRHYLLEDYAISYAPSLAVLKEMSARRRTGQTTSNSLLAFGNPTASQEVATNIKTAYRGETLGPLPDAELEVSALKNIWGSSSSQVLIGTSATKSVFRQEAPKYNIIHLATHGILDDSSPMYSSLIMARSNNDPTDDGLLEAREILQLNLRADLVVLSACDTARGRIGAGEGMIGMSWAFFVAGVPTMVASQWKVDSASTATLMIDFHKRLRAESPAQSQTRATALQQAALTLMKDPRYRHPYFWAGFVMIGNPS
jgi:CHAT domain-containing protein/lipoprotein NlpI